MTAPHLELREEAKKFVSECHCRYCEKLSGDYPGNKCFADNEVMADELVNLLLSKRQEWVESAIQYTLNTIHEDLAHMISTHDGFDKLLNGCLASLTGEKE